MGGRVEDEGVGGVVHLLHNGLERFETVGEGGITQAISDSNHYDGYEQNNQMNLSTRQERTTEPKTSMRWYCGRVSSTRCEWCCAEDGMMIRMDEE